MPIALVFGPISMRVSAIAVSFVIDPLTLILVSSHVPEYPLTMRLVETPVSIVTRPVLPDLDATSVPVMTFPLTEVLGSVLEDELGPILNRVIIIALVSLQAESTSSTSIFHAVRSVFSIAIF